MRCEVGFVPMADGGEVVLARVAGLSRWAVVDDEVGAASPQSKRQRRRATARRVLGRLAGVAKRVIGMTPQGRAAQAAISAARGALGGRARAPGRPALPAPPGAVPVAPGALSDSQRVALARRILRARGMSPAQQLIAVREVLS